MIPRLWLYLAAAGTLAASFAACYGAGYTRAQHAAGIERAKVEAVAEAADSRFRKLEKEVADAQSGYVKAWSIARDAARADWLRIKAAADRRVPIVCAESAGVETAGGDGLEDARREAAGVLHAAVSALERGAEVEATLMLCQAELRRCAALR